MTVQELIDELNKIKDKTLVVKIPSPYRVGEWTLEPIDKVSFYHDSWDYDDDYIYLEVFE